MTKAVQGGIGLDFDADQAPWDFRQVQRQSLWSTIDLMETEQIVAPGTVRPEDLQRVRDMVAQEFRGRPHSLEAVREQAFVKSLRIHGHPNPDVTGYRLAEHVLTARFDHILLHPDVAPAMARLKTRYRIGLLTNGNTYPDRCGLPNTFDVEVLGPAHGFEKPDDAASAMLFDLTLLLALEVGAVPDRP